MRNVLGAVLFMAAAGFVVRAWMLRRCVLASVGAAEFARRRAAALADPRSLSAFGEIARPLVLFGLGWLALKSTLAYVMLDGERVLSRFDLAGFVVLLAAYGVWFSVRATYWLPEQVTSVDAARGDAGSTGDDAGRTVAGRAATTTAETTGSRSDGAEERSSRRAA